jgi:hypothetical protein
LLVSNGALKTPSASTLKVAIYGMDTLQNRFPGKQSFERDFTNQSRDVLEQRNTQRSILTS